MRSNYPHVVLTNGNLTFYNGKAVSLPTEYEKPRNKELLDNFYKNLLSDNSEELKMGTDPLGFDYVLYQNLCNVGLLIGLSNSSEANNNRKKYPYHKFSREYIKFRIADDKAIQNYEKFLPVEAVTQNVHELRNLNFKISSSIDEILNSVSDEDWESKFDNADDNIKKIYVSSRLIKFILDNIKFYMPNYIENLKPTNDRQFSIHKSVNKIVKIYSNDFKKKKAAIDFEGNTFRLLQGDKELFEIVLMLLMENSIKYSRDPYSIHPRVKISQDKNNGSTNISIQSYGNLIPDDEVQKLFTRGFRSSVHNMIKDGTGMGLHNAGKIIKLYSGELTYSKISASQEDKTTGWNCFNILVIKTSE